MAVGLGASSAAVAAEGAGALSGAKFAEDGHLHTARKDWEERQGFDRACFDASHDDPVDEVLCTFDAEVDTWICADATIDESYAEPPAGWLTEVGLDGEVPEGVAEALAGYWTDVAALDAAAVAASARLTLALLAEGASLDIVGEAQHAGLDAGEHARLAADLATVWSRTSEDSTLARSLVPGFCSCAGLRE